ncbi:MAG: shikimate kinase [Candidatus Geothermincolia bacterium]
MSKTNIILIGFMYAGKTTVGEAVAAATGKAFVDTDSLIEQKAGLTVEEIFGRDGEGRFREMERGVVSHVTGVGDQVISLGGGAVLDERNVRDSKRDGVIYFLEVSAPTVARRASRESGRPLLEGRTVDQIEEMMSERRGCYASAADVVVAADSREAGLIAEEIAADFHERSKAPSEPRGQ